MFFASSVVMNFWMRRSARMWWNAVLQTLSTWRSNDRVLSKVTPKLWPFGYRNVDAAEWNGANRTLLPAPCTGPDNNRFGLIRVKCKSVESEPSVDSFETFIHSRLSINTVQRQVKLCVVGILGMQDVERLDDIRDRRSVQWEQDRTKYRPLWHTVLASSGRSSRLLPLVLLSSILTSNT